MYNSKSVLAIIPARSGSKGLPGKNIIDLNGLPLIAWSIKAALKSSFIDYILVSTDCPIIRSISLEYGALVPFLRPSSLASDTATSYDVINHSLDYLDHSFDTTVLLEPTSPLRQDGDIDSVISHLWDHSDSFDSVVTVGEVKDSPYSMFTLNDSFVNPLLQAKTHFTRRQDTPSVFFPFGVAYASFSNILYRSKSFFTPKTGYKKINSPIQNLEIDDIYDLWSASVIVKNTNILDWL